jgi:hypothetical protein
VIGEILKQAKEASISATITRADGSIEQLGVISYWHKNPLKRWMWRAKQSVKEIMKW